MELTVYLHGFWALEILETLGASWVPLVLDGFVMASTFSAAMTPVLSTSPEQEEMLRIEEEQSFEELKILRELVHEQFHKQEELAEVGDPPRESVFTPSTLSASWGTENEEWHLTPCLCLWYSRVLISD